MDSRYDRGTSGGQVNPYKAVYLERLLFMQRVLVFYAHWHVSSYEEVPPEEILLNVARFVRIPMGGSLEYLNHGMDTWTYRHEFFLLGLIAQKTEPAFRHPKSVKLDCRPQEEAGPPKPPEKVKREPGAALRNGIDGIVTAHRATWGGAPGGFIQGRASEFGRRLRAYASWFIDQNDREPSLYHLGKVALRMERWGYSSLGREVGEKEFRLVFKACKESAGNS